MHFLVPSFASLLLQPQVPKGQCSHLKQALSCVQSLHSCLSLPPTNGPNAQAAKSQHLGGCWSPLLYPGQCLLHRWHEVCFWSSARNPAWLQCCDTAGTSAGSCKELQLGSRHHSASTAASPALCTLPQQQQLVCAPTWPGPHLHSQTVPPGADLVTVLGFDSIRHS